MKRYLLITVIFIAIFAFAKARGNIFCEEMTATNCHACPAVSDILHEIYNSGDYPFYYVSMVTDKNDEAKERAEYYNIIAYPTTIFDGGYEVIFGKKDKSFFENAIENSLQRKRVNIKLSLDVKWVGENRIEISYNIKNNENENYEGFFKIYVVEPTSRWKDNEGDYYHFGFLSFAKEEIININAGGEIAENVIWNASEHGYEISRDNIMAIAVVFNKEGNTGYSDPPENEHSFIAHYVDACTAEEPAPDSPPHIEFLKMPGSIVGYTNVSFEWEGSDDYGDVLFSYKLKNYEAEWHEWSNVREVSYSNLQDGEYEFFVRGKDNVGQITTISYRFSVDTSNPRVIEHSPKANEKGVPVQTKIRIKFSHEMNKSSVEKGLKIEPSVPYTVQWKNGNEIFIYPQELEYETVYTVKIRNAYRTSGQVMPEYSFSFETSSKDTTPPHIIYAKPLNGEIENSIEIKFSEPMDTLLHNALKIEPWVKYKYNWEENDTLLKINFFEYIPGSYKIFITNFIADKYGNPLEENFSFYAYITKPKIIYKSIEDGEKNVEVHTTLELEFSHEMNKSSVENALSISPQANYTISWSKNKIFIKMELEKDKTYRIFISKNAEDKRGISMENDFFLNFSTIENIKREIEINETPSFGFVMFVFAILIVIKKLKKDSFH
ncbi:MAG TPA: hypothetical protein ENI33_06635 [Thermoplasmatales archaeon]|nr:hypothetical protein [Thermoplasmatales archaeon]